MAAAKRPNARTDRRPLSERFAGTPLGWFFGLDRRDRTKFVWSVVGLAATAFLLWRWFSGPPKFPAHVGPTPTFTEGELAAPRLAPAPKTPTASNLNVGVPQKIPGLGDVRGALDPTLSADLKTLVFVVESGPQGGRDLMMSRREAPTRPFPAPAPLASVNSPAAEQSPTLSRDGRELIFLRDGAPFLADRADPELPFRTPVPLTLPGVDPAKDAVDAFQLFTDEMYLAYRLTARDPAAPQPRQRYALAFRVARGEPFESTEVLPTWSPWAVNRLSADALRCFVADGEGLSVSARVGRSDKFGMPGLLQRLTADRIGPIVGTFWVAPKEDLLVYASPGPPTGAARTKAAAKPAADRPTGLWMVRFH